MCPFFLLKARFFFQGKYAQVRSGIEGFRTVDLTQTITLYLCVVGDVPAHGAPLWVSISQCSTFCYVFFAAAASDAVTGQSLSVDGGLTMP